MKSLRKGEVPKLFKDKSMGACQSFGHAYPKGELHRV